MPVVDLLAVRAERGCDPAAPALLYLADGDGAPHRVRQLTGSELERAVEVRADELHRRGLEPATLVPVTVEADRAGVEELLALWRLGAVPVPLNTRLTPSERSEAEATLEGAAPAGAQAVVWTSGTAGQPRGVALSFAGLLASAESAATRLGLSGLGDTWLASLSPAHVGGLALVVRALLLGSQIAAFGRLSPGGISAAIDGDTGHAGDHDPVTHLSLVPTQLLGLLEHRGYGPPPPTLVSVLIGGAHAPRPLVDRALQAGWPVALTYGMTEMSSQVATAAPSDVVRKPGSVGRPLAGAEVDVGENGEVLVRGPTLALGYVGDVTPIVDQDGWHHTGDLGAIDEEGDLWITGRRSERILSGGVTVDAGEVEGTLRLHPAVVDACVVGLPDPRWGEVVAAGLIGVEGELDISELEDWCRSRLGAAKRPRAWLLLDALPLNANGKVDRAEVRERLLAL